MKLLYNYDIRITPTEKISQTSTCIYFAWSKWLIGWCSYTFFTWMIRIQRWPQTWLKINEAYGKFRHMHYSVTGRKALFRRYSNRNLNVEICFKFRVRDSLIQFNLSRKTDNLNYIGFSRQCGTVTVQTWYTNKNNAKLSPCLGGRQ